MHKKSQVFSLLLCFVSLLLVILFFKLFYFVDPAVFTSNYYNNLWIMSFDFDSLFARVQKQQNLHTYTYTPADKATRNDFAIKFLITPLQCPKKILTNRN